MRYTYYDFFCGGGMAGVGLGADWRCAFANDIDPKKAAAFQKNDPYGLSPVVDDIASLKAEDLPCQANGAPVDLAWASFPCQDLSLAGRGGGLDGARSGAFWSFWRLMRGLRAENRAPRVIVLENVGGAVSSRGGRDLADILDAVASDGYRVGALMMNADAFVPQSRPRLFIIAVENALFSAASPRSASNVASPLYHSAALRSAADLACPEAQDAWVWWTPPTPPARKTQLGDVVDMGNEGSDWRTGAQTKRLLALMAPLHQNKVIDATKSGKRVVGAVFRRTRREEGKSQQRAEVRFDGLAGCLRTPSGGSSRQLLLFVEGDRCASRLVRPREAARLMGLPDSYALPEKTIEALHLLGDGVSPPVVSHLARHILEPVLAAEKAEGRKAVA